MYVQPLQEGIYIFSPKEGEKGPRWKSGYYVVLGKYAMHARLRTYVHLYGVDQCTEIGSSRYGSGVTYIFLFS